MSSILRTEALIKTIRRRAFIPSSQETFLDEDFLEMATEEINLGILPLLLKMHEEHLVYFVDVPIDSSTNRYAIPARAYGNKIRDVALLDENNNVYEMFRYSLTELSDFSNSNAFVNSRGFYLENNNIVLTNLDENRNLSLRIYFYLRPNVLVKEDRGASISLVEYATQVDNINPLSGSISDISVANPTVLTSANHGLTGGQKIIISASNSTPSIDGTYEVTVIDSNTFSIPVDVTVAGTTAGWSLGIDVVNVTVDDIPDHFPTTELFDFTQYLSPNKIISYDVPVNSINQTLNQLSFPVNRVGGLMVGDYITAAEESIVPNIPTELHPLLAQRVAIACLEAMGDEQNKQSAERKLKQYEDNANTFLDNRAEGSQVKIKARHSPLVQTLNTLGRRNRRW